MYAAAESADGVPVVVESYWSTSQIDDDARAAMVRIAPLALGALGIFALMVFPLAWTLAVRVDRAQGERGTLVRHALAASDLERHRIARDLHDGVLQDVSGAGYALNAATSALPETAELPRRLLGEVSAVLRGVGNSLRSTMTEIYPPDLARGGLPAALEELALHLDDSGVDVSLDVSDLADSSLEVAQLSYRAIREGLRNVVRHAHADHAVVTARAEGGTVSITVEDDGRGLPGHAPEGAHLGLRLLEDTVSEVGGALTIGPRTGGGTVLAISFPSELAGR